MQTKSEMPPLVVTINGETRTYAPDKAGKRQAILDSLRAIPTLRVDDAVYLPSNDALQAVAAVLYPAGIQSREAYDTVCQVTERACAHLGFGAEVELGPPAVPFSQRGAYHKQFPPLDPQPLLNELRRAGTDRTLPQQQIAGSILWNQAGLAVYGKPWHQLTAAQKEQMQAQVTAVAAGDGWTLDETGSTPQYIKPLPLDTEAVRHRLQRLLEGEHGRPLAVGTVVYAAQRGAYGRGFYTHDFPPPLQEIVDAVLTVHGYQTTPTDGVYLPHPIILDGETATAVGRQIAALPLRQTEAGPGLLLDDVLTLVQEAVGVETMSEWQVEHLLQDGPLGDALRRLGVRTAVRWLPAYRFQPPFADGESRAVLLKEIRVRQEPGKTISLAQGLAVYTPALTIDDEEDTLIYLEMVGVKQAARANWAALMGGGKVHWLGRQRIRLEGMKQHLKIQTTLPCGWVNQILLHKQASLQEMNPAQPFYLLDDGSHSALSQSKWPIPPLFYPMLNKALALPLLPDWAEVLWGDGRARELISLLNDGAGQGYAAWRVLPAAEEWRNLVERGLKTGRIAF